jgi:UDP-glucose 4-epimerase
VASFLVTGGAGFIGSHVCDQLLDAGHKVIVIDDLSTGKKENLSPQVTLIPACMMTKGLIHTLTESVDGIFHLAAIASVQKCSDFWAETHGVNVTATLCVFEAAKAHNKPVVYASSAAVYGVPSVLPLTEDVPLNPISHYGLDKKSCEDYARIAAGLYGLKTIGLRFFNVYGERQDPKSPYSGVISVFMGAAGDRTPLTILGSGNQTRDFIYVGDVARAVRVCMARLMGYEEQSEGIADVYNVATGKDYTIQTLAEKILALSGSNQPLVYADPRLGDIEQSLGNATALTQATGWSAEVSFDEGLTRLWASHRG